jgi:hypothetical protein
VFIVKLCCLTVSILLKKKKKLCCVACSRNDGVITYGIRARFDPRLGITTDFVDLIFDYKVVN